MPLMPEASLSRLYADDVLHPMHGRKLRFQLRAADESALSTASFVQGIADCREAHAVGTPERDACVDGQQLLLFQCRDTCRESVQVWASLKTCRQEFKADIKACPAPPAMPTVMGP